MAVVLKNDEGKTHMDLQISLPDDPQRPAYKSRERRQILVKMESGESFSFGAMKSSSSWEVLEWIGDFLDVDPGTLHIMRQDGRGNFRRMQHHEECPPVAHLRGVKSLKRSVKQYDHPIVVVGAGLGGVQCMIDLRRRGRQNIVCVEKIHDFGGWSWTYVPNKYTKLQTESGSYYVEYPDPNANPPKMIRNTNHKFGTWPSRDEILMLVREEARARGLQDVTQFGCEIQKIVKKNNYYALQWTPTPWSQTPDEDGGIILGGAVASWIGFLHDLNTIEFPGEDDFGGYIEYSSFDKFDYTRTTGKNVVMYGHGAFTIENVRTLCEFRCKKVFVICRRRNLCGTKMTSWLVSHQESPAPGTVILDSFQRMFDLVGYNVWENEAVTTDKNRTFAHISQKTIFGVTDVYFLAGYYGLMEVVVDEIKRLSYQTVHTKNLNRKIECEAIIKAIGTHPSFKIAKQLSIKHCLGPFCNSDPLRFIMLGSKSVSAQNYGSFSINPALAPNIKVCNWFIDYPDDFDKIKDDLPKQENWKWPCYITEPAFMNQYFGAVAKIPGVAFELGEAQAIKAVKTNYAHPVEDYLAEVKAEWQCYIKYFKEHNMVDDRPEPEYPYTIEIMAEFDRRAEESWASIRAGVKPKKEGEKIADNNIYATKAVSDKPKAETVTIKTEGREVFTFPKNGSMKVSEVAELMKEKLDSLGGTSEEWGLTKLEDDGIHTFLSDAEAECPSMVYLHGITSLRKQPKRYDDHPIVVVGAGVGATVCMIDIKHRRGYQNMVCLEKLGDFGGSSWMLVSNKFTKLQTERGTYFTEYLDVGAFPPSIIGDGKVKYRTWPSRDQILIMCREGARSRGLEEHARFNTEVQKITDKSDGYAIQWTSTLDDKDDGGVLMAGAVSCWPGFLHAPNTCEFAGEDQFGGYIEYSSFDMFDYTRATGKRVMMYGHGAFTIENVRTLCEFRAAHIEVVCRTRNLCGTKMTSWLISSMPNPVPATVVLDSFARQFDLVGFDAWGAHSVKTNKTRSWAIIDQKTIFGVTDIYFLAGAYGLMDVTVDEVARLSHHCVHTKNLQKKIECEVIIKAIGTVPSFKIQKQLGIKSMLGTWCNGDPLRPVSMMTKGANAQNFGTFSFGPGLSALNLNTNWFFQWPETFESVRDKLPTNNPSDWPLFVSGPSYYLQFMTPITTRIPSLAIQNLKYGDKHKASKTQKCHPLEEYLGECVAEWKMYCKYFQDNNMVDDRPEPEYPYTEEIVRGFIRRSNAPYGIDSDRNDGS